MGRPKCQHWKTSVALDRRATCAIVAATADEPMPRPEREASMGTDLPSLVEYVAGEVDLRTRGAETIQQQRNMEERGNSARRPIAALSTLWCRHVRTVVRIHNSQAQIMTTQSL